MAENHRHGALALIAGGLLAMTAGLVALDQAHAAERIVRRPAAHGPVPRPRLARTAAARPLTIRRRAGAPIDVVGGPGYFGDEYIVRQHAWNDPRSIILDRSAPAARPSTAIRPAIRSPVAMRAWVRSPVMVGLGVATADRISMRSGGSTTVRDRISRSTTTMPRAAWPVRTTATSSRATRASPRACRR